jgi:hypothetical protein
VIWGRNEEIRVLDQQADSASGEAAAAHAAAHLGAAEAITGPLLRWYDRHRRDLPWRAGAGATPDP